MCIWVCSQSFKLIMDDYILNLNSDDDCFFEEYLKENKLNLKRKKYSFNIKVDSTLYYIIIKR